MAGWVDEFQAYAETAVSRVTTVTASKSLTIPGTQFGEPTVTAGCIVEVSSNNSPKVETQETTMPSIGLPLKTNEFKVVTQVTQVTGESDSYEQQYLIDEREAILQFCGCLPRDEAVP